LYSEEILADEQAIAQYSNRKLPMMKWRS